VISDNGESIQITESHTFTEYSYKQSCILTEQPFVTQTAERSLIIFCLATRNMTCEQSISIKFGKYTQGLTMCVITR